MSAEHVLILGGTRFIGPAVVRALVQGGYAPTIFHRGQSAWPLPKEELPESMRGDRRELADLERVAALREWAAVVDCTAYTAADSAKAIEAFNERCGVFVHISTGSIYQVLRDFHNPYAEEDALLFADPLPLVDEDPNHPGMLYGLNKRGCEEVLFNAHEETGFPMTVIRPPVVSGPGDYTLRDFTHLLRLQDGGPLLAPINSGSFRHVAVQDLAQLIVAAIDNWDTSVGEAFNAGGATICSFTEYIQTFARVLGYKTPEIIPVSFEQLEQRVGTGANPFAYGRNAIPDIQKAASLLDWHPRRATDYLPEVAAWCEEVYTGEHPESYTAYREKELTLARELSTSASAAR